MCLEAKSGEVDVRGCDRRRHKNADRPRLVGAKLMATMLNLLERDDGRYGLQTMCVGGGMANATLVEQIR
jgi:hypothetical protein